MISEDALHTLEFHKVLLAVEAYGSFSAGKDRIRSLRPSSDLDEVERSLREVTEARSLLDSRPNITIGGARDVRQAAKRAGLGSVLRTEELLDVVSTLEASRDLRSSISKSEIDLPLIRESAARLVSFPEIINRINDSLDPAGEVLDSASPRLRQVRQDIRSAHGRIVDKMNSMVSSSEYRTSLQENIVTVRNGRYVLPVKSEARSKIPGIIHDQSSSGQTSFIEPLAVTELNNRWAELQLEEQREIERILEELSRRVGAQAAAIVDAVEALGELDCAFARAKYATALVAYRPSLNTDGRINLLQARHPLLTGDVVPISVTLGEGFSVLVITGPNTGGKTVALKTVGLLTLMAQSGLHLPVHDGSQVAIFESVWADIGDEQSIEQSLSTFSSHLRNIIKILAQTEETSLVLLDELGAGTDPQEGSGLARSIIRELLDRQARAVVTTHYSELKAFAHEQPGVENASVEFDVSTLSPTYRLVIGIPGRSQALAIAKRLGLPTSIIERARSYVSQGGLRIERLLSQIQQERQSIGQLYRRAQELNDDLGKVRDRLEAEVSRTRDERDKVLREARGEATEALRNLRRRLSELEAQANRSGSARPAAQVRAIRQRVDEVRGEVFQELGHEEAQATQPESLPGAIAVGDEVFVASIGQNGTVTKVVGNEFEIQAGHFKLRRPAEDVQRIKAAPSSQPRVSLKVAQRDRTVPEEIDIRGRRPQEVEPEIERYVNDSYMGGLQTLRIIHGKGTGFLRQAVREQLEAHPLVAGLTAAGKDQGGDGVTIVTLAT